VAYWELHCNIPIVLRHLVLTLIEGESFGTHRNICDHRRKIQVGWHVDIEHFISSFHFIVMSTVHPLFGSLVKNLFFRWVDEINQRVLKLNQVSFHQTRLANDAQGENFNIIENLDHDVSFIHHEIPRHVNNNDGRFGVKDETIVGAKQKWNESYHVNIILSSWEAFVATLNTTTGKNPRVRDWINLYHVTDLIAEECGRIKDILRFNMETGKTGSIPIHPIN